MQPKLLNALANKMPKFNEEICANFHKREFEQIEKFYERLLKIVFEPLASRGVFFRGIVPVKPEEMFKVVSESTQNKTFEINKESLYPSKLLIDVVDSQGNVRSFDNVYQMLPFTDEYGDVWIRGTKYSLQIVMGDRGMSVTKDEQIFVKILGYKFKIGSENMGMNRVFVGGGMPIFKQSYLNLSANRFYNASKMFEVKGTKTPKPLLAWYMFAVYGFSKTMKDFAECEYMIGGLSEISEVCKEKDGWQIYSSTGKVNEKLITPYTPLDICMAVRSTNKNRWGEELPTISMQYVAAFIYTVDIAPTLIDLDSLDSTDYWKLIIGKCSMVNKNGDKSILKQMNDHFDSLNERLDSSSIERFAAQSIKVKNMFELFNHIIGSRTEFVKTFDRAQMFNKELCSLEYTIDRLVTSATRFKHDIKNTTDLSFEKIRSFVTKHFRIRDIERSAWEGNMILHSTPTDCPLVDYVLGVIPQIKLVGASGQRSKGEFNPQDNANAIHPSLIFVMSAERVTKPVPDGRGYLNPYVQINSAGVIVIPEKLRELYIKTSNRLTYSEKENVAKPESRVETKS